MDIVTEKNDRRLRELAGKKISSMVVDERGNCLLLLSGGSSLSVVDYIDIPKEYFKNMTITMLDDRFEGDPSKNNFCLLSETEFYKIATKNGANFISTKIDGYKDVCLRGEIFNKDLIDWSKRNPVRSVFAIMGVGVDSHVGGVMPFNSQKELFENRFLKTNLFALGYDASGKNEFPYRITTTLYFMEKMIDKAVVYVSGENKINVLRKILENKIDINECPAIIVNKIKEVSIFTDNEI